MRKLIPTRWYRTAAQSHVVCRAELVELSDWCLKDIGLARRSENLEVVKPFWMS
ncbi:MAG TPA: DUF1127 domain-containing protein [Steroidobacteraceae bacterium]